MVLETGVYYLVETSVVITRRCKQRYKNVMVRNQGWSPEGTILLPSLQAAGESTSALQEQVHFPLIRAPYLPFSTSYPTLAQKPGSVQHKCFASRSPRVSASVSECTCVSECPDTHATGLLPLLLWMPDAVCQASLWPCLARHPYPTSHFPCRTYTDGIVFT